MQKFAIMSPTLGMREDVPTILLNKVYTEDNSNTVIRYGEIKRIKGRAAEILDASADQVQPDTIPILKYHRLVIATTGAEYLFAFTKARIYQWNSATYAWDSRHTNASECTTWDVITFNNVVIATNNIDKVITADGTGSFTVLGASGGLEYASGLFLTKCKFIFSFENYVILGYTMENGSTYPQRIRWCKIGDASSSDAFMTGDAGAAEVGQADFLTGIDSYQGFCIIFKEKSYYKMWLVTSNEVFNIAAMSNSVGCFARDSIIHDESGELFFLTSDYTIQSVRGAVISDPIDKTMKQIAPDYTEFIRAHYNRKYGELWWSIPYGSTATENNRVIMFTEGKWSHSNMEISAFGVYSRQIVYNWSTLPFTTWSAWGWDAWLDPAGAAGFLIELAADYSGYSWGLNLSDQDKGTDITGYCILDTDLADKSATDIYKRIILARVYVRSEIAGTVVLTIKRDNEFTWQTLGSASLVASDQQPIIIVDVPCDFRARNFQIKIAGDSSFSFIGIVFGYTSSGSDR